MPATILFDQFSDMDEPALLFWESLQESLARHDLTPVLINYRKPVRPTNIPLVTTFYRLTEICGEKADSELHPPVSQEEIDLVRKIAGNWGQEVSSDDHARSIAYGCKNFANAVLDQYQPALLILWNGHHLNQTFLRRAADERGIPVVFMERSPFSNWLVFDDAGILAGSSFGRLELDDLDAVTESEQLAATDFLELVASSPTWYQQPENIGSIHRKMKIPQGRELLTFFGQVDYDTQNFLFNPYFENNVQAWEWFVEITTQLGDRYHRIGKHHPKSTTPPEAYPQFGVDRANWRADLPLEAVLQQSQAFASVNSSANTDAMLARKPVLFLGGGSYYSGKQVAYEVHPEMSEEEIHEELYAWLFDARAITHRYNLLRCVSHLLGHHMIAIDGEQRKRFGLSMEAVADWISSRAKVGKSAQHLVYSNEAASAYLELYCSRSELLQQFYESRRELDSLRAEQEENLSSLRKENAKLKKRKEGDIKKLKKEIKHLKSDVRSAEKWQRSWVKRVFHRWRPKKR